MDKPLISNDSAKALDDDGVELTLDTLICDYSLGGPFTHSKLSFSCSCARVCSLKNLSVPNLLVEFFDEEIIPARHPPPNIEIIIEQGESNVDVQISLEPLVCFLNPSFLQNVTQFMNSLNMVSTAKQSDVNYRLSLVLKKIEIVALYVPPTGLENYLPSSLQKHNEYSIFSDLVGPDRLRDCQAKRWENGPLPSFLREKSTECCGFRFSVEAGDIIISYFGYSGQTRVEEIEFASAFGYLLLVDDDKGMSGHSLQFLSMTGTLDQRLRISLQHTETARTKVGSTGSDSGFNESHQVYHSDIDRAVKTLTDVLVVECKKVVLDLWDSEYALCLSMMTRMSQLLSVNDVDIANPTPIGTTSFGYKITADVLISNLSKNIDKDNSPVETTTGMGAGGFYCLAAQKMELLICVEAFRMNMRLTTADFSFFESSDTFANNELSPSPVLFCTKHESQVNTKGQEAFNLSVLLTDEPGVVEGEVVKHASVSLALSVSPCSSQFIT